MLCTSSNESKAVSIPIHSVLYGAPQHRSTVLPPSSDPNFPPPNAHYPSLGLLHEFSYPFTSVHHYGRHPKPIGMISDNVQDNAIHSSGVVYGATTSHVETTGDAPAVDGSTDSLTTCKTFWENLVPSNSPLNSKLTSLTDVAANTTIGVPLKPPSGNIRLSAKISTYSTSKKRKRVATIAQRRAANIRERRRMYNLNEAFDKLRRKVPTFAYEKRLSRIETLKLAITYITFMDDVLRKEKMRVTTYSGSEESITPANNGADYY